MVINLVVAVTDDDWFEMLRRHPNLSEVNFWAPSAANFRALQPGEMFLFKLHASRRPHRLQLRKTIGGPRSLTTRAPAQIATAVPQAIGA